MSRERSECLRRYRLPEFDPAWAAVRRGIERECLRVSPDGRIAATPHPAALGAALTNPFITTDFSEALLEFITPTFADIDPCLEMLDAIHRFAQRNLENDEMLWMASMPCPLEPDAEIPIARYGASNLGRLKTLYRRGLSHRYGSLMQAISGLHYNFSMSDSFWEPYRALRGAEEPLQDFRTAQYMRLIRNFHRWAWLLIYLFGASPAACRCFVTGRAHGLEPLDRDSLHLPHATCLRMGDLGYRSEAQNALFVCYDDLDAYVECLRRAIRAPHPEYEKIGLRRNGERIQINTGVLQMEDEFYSVIRPKRAARAGERPLDALVARGVEYVEVRAFDVNPYLPLGIDAEQARFVDAFLLHCLLSDSPRCGEREYFEAAGNVARVVGRGRDPALKLERAGGSRGFAEWAMELLDDIEHGAVLLDAAGGRHAAAVAAQRAKVLDPGLTPSGRMLADMRKGRTPFFEFSMERSREHRRAFEGGELDEGTREKMEKAAAESRIRKKEIEAADEVDFDAYLEAFVGDGGG